MMRNIEKNKEFLMSQDILVKESPNQMECSNKREISVEEAREFLKIIQQSEFKVIEQLNKMPARISLLGLLMHLEPHRKLLMKILNEAYAVHDISLEKFGGIIGNIMAHNYLTFTDEEIPTEGRGHNKALHITAKCMNYVLAKILVDNGSSLNVMPTVTLERLPCDGMYMKPSFMPTVVKGEIELSIQIGLCTFQVVFLVMDIMPAYSCLLGRPWIHSAGVVPSSLHQKMKFISGDQLITVMAKKDILVSCLTNAPYIEAAEETLEIAFQALEIISTAYVETPPI